jgi:hypothetical protein
MTRSWNSLAAACLALTLSIALLPGPSRAADAGSDLQQALGSQAPLYKFPAGDLAAAVKVCASRDPAQAGACVALILQSGRPDADAIAPSLVQAAIQGLGPDPKPSLVAGIVKAAVTAAPSEVLDIVKAAVKASPGAAPAIVKAAVTSVPHPEDMVSVNSQPRAERLPGSDKQASDGKSASAPEQLLTIAEAIVQAAVAADPGLSTDVLTAAMDAALTPAAPAPGSPPSSLTVVLAPPTPIIPDPGLVSP